MIDLSHENDRRTLHRTRNRVTADSPDGHTYSNILELRENWESRGRAISRSGICRG